MEGLKEEGLALQGEGRPEASETSGLSRFSR